METRATNSENNISSLQSNQAVLQTTSAQHTTELTSLDTRLTAAETINSTQSANIATVDTRSQNNANDITVLENGVSNLEVRATALETQQASNTTQIS